jgi:hypothetical protein
MVSSVICTNISENDGSGGGRWDCKGVAQASTCVHIHSQWNWLHEDKLQQVLIVIWDSNLEPDWIKLKKNFSPFIKGFLNQIVIGMLKNIWENYQKDDKMQNTSFTALWSSIGDYLVSWPRNSEDTRDKNLFVWIEKPAHIC